MALPIKPTPELSGEASKRFNTIISKPLGIPKEKIESIKKQLESFLSSQTKETLSVWLKKDEKELKKIRKQNVANSKPND